MKIGSRTRAQSGLFDSHAEELRNATTVVQIFQLIRHTSNHKFSKIQTALLALSALTTSVYQTL